MGEGREGLRDSLQFVREGTLPPHLSFPALPLVISAGYLGEAFFVRELLTLRGAFKFQVSKSHQYRSFLPLSVCPSASVYAVSDLCF